MDPFSLALKYKEIDGVEISLIIDQIRGRAISKKKIPTWHEHDGIIFPPKISMEQCSSEQTALYKSSLLSGKKFVDLTGGAGVDSFFMGKKFSEAHYVEQNENLFEITHHNIQALGQQHFHYHNMTAEEYLSSFNGEADLIFIDPARRGKAGQKVFKLADCEPDIIKLIPTLMKRGKVVMVKASPMLDIASALEDLAFISELHVISVNNECKELLFILKSDKQELKISTINLQSKENQRYDFTLLEERKAAVGGYSSPLRCLYEPNASILKAGAFKSITNKFKILKLHPNTHLYTSDQPITGFPGRCFEILDVVRYNRKELIKALPAQKANLATRNFPEDVVSIKKKMKIKDGGDIYLFACTTHDEKKILIITKKLEE